MPNKTSKIEELVEKYRFWIGGILILAIVGGSFVLIYRENYSKPKLEDRIAKLENRIGELEASQKNSKSQPTLNQPKAENVQTEQGTVAGTQSLDNSK